VAVSGFTEGIPADQHRTWFLGVVEAEKRIGKADDSAGALVATAPNGFRQRVIGPVRKRVAVDH
jgi:hypothetical protein